MEGHALKQGQKGLVKTWKKRWLVLRDTRVFYYVFPSDKFPKGAIELDQATNIALVANNFGKKLGWGFQINTPNRDWHLIVNSEEEANRWVNALNKARMGRGREDLFAQYDSFTKEQLISLLIEKDNDLVFCRKELMELRNSLVNSFKPPSPLPPSIAANNYSSSSPALSSLTRTSSSTIATPTSSTSSPSSSSGNLSPRDRCSTTPISTSQPTASTSPTPPTSLLNPSFPSSPLLSHVSSPVLPSFTSHRAIAPTSSSSSSSSLSSLSTSLSLNTRELGSGSAISGANSRRATNFSAIPAFSPSLLLQDPGDDALSLLLPSPTSTAPSNPIPASTLTTPPPTISISPRFLTTPTSSSSPSSSGSSTPTTTPSSPVSSPASSQIISTTDGIGNDGTNGSSNNNRRSSRSSSDIIVGLRPIPPTTVN